MKLFSALKRNTVYIEAPTWRTLSQTHKAACCLTHLYDMLEKAKLCGQKIDQWLSGIGVGEGLTIKVHSSEWVGGYVSG